MKYQERIQKLLDEQEKSRARLLKVKERRMFEIGKIAIEVGIDTLDNKTLRSYFKEIYYDRQKR
tara:strand:+ start:2443 stop:2634 length:192 start_codon:yes stop_codon:yes gene_type:complete